MEGIKEHILELEEAYTPEGQHVREKHRLANHLLTLKDKIIELRDSLADIAGEIQDYHDSTQLEQAGRGKDYLFSLEESKREKEHELKEKVAELRKRTEQVKQTEIMLESLYGNIETLNEYFMIAAQLRLHWQKNEKESNKGPAYSSHSRRY